MTTPVIELAAEFSRHLRAYLTMDQMAECIARNALETRADVCHSHDHCDANQFMLDALESLGIEYDSSSQTQADLTNAAWDHAKATRFSISGTARTFYDFPPARMILAAVREAMQDAEEIGGPEGEGYLALMEAIAAEANTRRAIYLQTLANQD